MDAQYVTRAKRLLARKKAIGRPASYTQLEQRTGRNRKTLHTVLQALESPIKMDRVRILVEVSRALDDIENDLIKEAEADAATYRAI